MFWTEALSYFFSAVSKMPSRFLLHFMNEITFQQPMLLPYRVPRLVFSRLEGIPVLHRMYGVLLETKQAFHQHLDKLSALGLSVHLAFVTIVGCGEALEDDSVLQVGQNTLDVHKINEYDQSSVSFNALVTPTESLQIRCRMKDSCSSRWRCEVTLIGLRLLSKP
jgi:hypothetical protein